MDIQETRMIQGKSARDCYYAALIALPKVGFVLWKKRDFAWFAIAKRRIGATEVTANIMSKPGKETSVVLGVSADTIDEAELHRYADEFFQVLQATLA